MNNILNCELNLIDDKVRFAATSGDNLPLSIDYYPPLGSGKGYTSLELLLMSAASCVSTAVKAIAASKFKKNINDMKVKVSGERKKEHPASLKNIDIHIFINSTDTCVDELNEIAMYSIHNICPVTNMLDSRIPISIEFYIGEDVGE